MAFDCNAMEDTHNTYCVAGMNKDEDDHLRKMWIFCSCVSCRPPSFDFENCRMKSWLGRWEDHTIAYTSSVEKAAKKEAMKVKLSAFCDSVASMTFLVVGMSDAGVQADEFAGSGDEEVQFRYYIVKALNRPYVTTERITENVDGIIQKGKRACEVLWLRRIEGFKFEPDVDDRDNGVRKIEMSSCILVTPHVELENLGDGTYKITPDSHRRINQRNLARFSSYH